MWKFLLLISTLCNALRITHKNIKFISRSPLHIATENTENTAAEDTRILRQTAMMISLWNGVTFPPEDGTLDMKLSDYGLNRGDVRGVLNHFQNCKDCAGILTSFYPKLTIFRHNNS